MKKKIIRITTVPESLDKLLDQQLGFMNQFFEVIAVSSVGEALKKVKEKEQIRVYAVNMTRKITPFKDLLAIIKLYFFLKREKPLIVHTHTPKAGVVGMISAWLACIPNRFHTVAGLPLLEERGMKRRLLNLVETLTYFFATKVYPNSHGLKQIIIDHNFCPREKLKVLGQGSSNGIDTSFFSVNQIDKKIINQIIEKYELEGKMVLIYVGRLVKDKGIEELCEAFSNLSQFNNQLTLLLVGNFESNLDPLSDSTLQIIKNNGKIKHVGFQNDVRPFLAVSNLLVFPSYREGFPNVVLQALSMELPAIVTNINGSNEIIKNKYNGLIVSSKDEKALRFAIEEIISNRSLYLELKQNSRKSIIGKFDREYIWNCLLREYNQVLSLES